MKLQLVPRPPGLVWVRQAFRVFCASRSASPACSRPACSLFAARPGPARRPVAAARAAAGRLARLHDRDPARARRPRAAAAARSSSSLRAGRPRLLALLKLGVAYAAATWLIAAGSAASSTAARSTRSSERRRRRRRTTPERRAARCADPRLQFGLLLRLGAAGAALGAVLARAGAGPLGRPELGQVALLQHRRDLAQQGRVRRLRPRPGSAVLLLFAIAQRSCVGAARAAAAVAARRDAADADLLDRSSTPASGSRSPTASTSTPTPTRRADRRRLHPSPRETRHEQGRHRHRRRQRHRPRLGARPAEGRLQRRARRPARRRARGDARRRRRRSAGNALAVPTDVTDPAAVKALFARDQGDASAGSTCCSTTPAPARRRSRSRT